MAYCAANVIIPETGKPPIYTKRAKKRDRTKQDHPMGRYSGEYWNISDGIPIKRGRDTNEWTVYTHTHHRRRGFIILSGNFLLSFSTCRARPPFSPGIKTAARGMSGPLFATVEMLIDPSVQTDAASIDRPSLPSPSAHRVCLWTSLQNGVPCLRLATVCAKQFVSAMTRETRAGGRLSSGLAVQS